MYTNGTQATVTARPSLPSPQTTSPSDSESDILYELDRKRRQLDEEVMNFRSQKDKEFREFERDLRDNRRRKSGTVSNLGGKNVQSSEKPPSRTSSSSALNLLAGRGTTKKSQATNATKTKYEPASQKKISSTNGPSVSQPVVSLDKLNIKGENALGRPQSPPTPSSTMLSRTLTRSSSSSSLATTPPRTKASPVPTKKSVDQVSLSPAEERNENSFAGLFTPSYLPLLESKQKSDFESSSTLETPPAEDEVSTAPSSFRSNTLSEVLSMTSSSFPPHVTMSPGGHTHVSKRAYTAPTVSSQRIPSALRTASGGAIGRKAKHVTFRLADSAIVEPSSSYEEGPSPSQEDGKSEKSTSGTRSPLRTSRSQLHRTLSPDEEDYEAGVQPGMGMGDVIQKLNEYSVAEAAKNGEDLVLEVEDQQESDSDDGDEDDDDDMPMVIGSRHEVHEEDASDRHFDVDYHEHDDETKDESDDEDGYFSPKTKHVSTMSPAPRDKDRLLFEARRQSDDSDDMHQRKLNTISSPHFDENGFSGTLKHSVDGGSGVGFFELDEELASPDAGQARPFEFDNDLDDADVTEDDNASAKTITPAGLGLSTAMSDEIVMVEQKKRWSGEASTKFGVGSVPIDIVRPSLSVSSSWVGTFGH